MSNNPFMPNSTPQTTTPVQMPGAMPGAVADDAFSVDLTEVKDDFSIPEGAYEAKCIDVTQDVSKSGNPMFVWTFELAKGDYAGRTFKSWTAVTPAAMWKVAETVMALGVGQKGEVVKFKRSDVIGKPCGLVMESDEYNGKPVSRVSRVISMQELHELQKQAVQ